MSNIVIEGTVTNINGTRKSIQMNNEDAWYLVKTPPMMDGVEQGTSIKLSAKKLGSAFFVQGIEIVEGEDTPPFETDEAAQREANEAAANASEQEHKEDLAAREEALADKPQRTPRGAPKNTAPEKPAKPARKSSSKKDGGTDWAAKDRSIEYQTCLKVAGQMIVAAQEAGALPLPTKKAERFDAMLDLLQEKTLVLVEGLLEHKFGG